MSTINATVVTNFVAKQMLEFFLNLNPLISTSNRDFVGAFMPQGYATGGQIQIKVPGAPDVTFGLQVDSPEAITDVVIPYTITQDDIYNVTREVNLYDMRFNFVEPIRALTEKQSQTIVDNYAYPAYQALAVAQEREAAYRLKTNSMLTPIDEIGKLTGINNFASMSNVNKFMTRMQLQTDQRYMMMNLDDAQNVANSLNNHFNNAVNKKIIDDAFVGGSAEKGRLAGMDIYQSNQLLAHTAGPLTGVDGITVSNLDETGTLLTLTGVTHTTAKLVNAGDRFSIPSVHLAARIGRDELPNKLVVTALTDANGDGAGNVTITLPYPLLASGMHTWVASLPAPGAPVIVYPSVNQNFSYVPSGLSVVPLPMHDIEGATNSSNEGLNDCPVKVVMQGAVLEFSNIVRISQLVGIRAFTPYVVAVPSSL